jgi:hypothetical protein
MGQSIHAGAVAHDSRLYPKTGRYPGLLGSEEPGLGGFNITLFDDAGGPGDATGQITYDMFNMPLANSLDGTIDPATGHNACPISKAAPSPSSGLTTSGITGTIVTCPTYEDDGKTQSPLAGQAVIANLMPGPVKCGRSLCGGAVAGLFRQPEEDQQRSRCRCGRVRGGCRCGGRHRDSNLVNVALHGGW